MTSYVWPKRGERNIFVGAEFDLDQVAFKFTFEVLMSGHIERGLPQRTAVSVRCGMLHSKQTLLTIIFWKHSSYAIKRNHSHFDS